MRDKTIAAVAENCSHLSDSALKRFELLTNRRFDLDACERDVAGKHCWVHAPSELPVLTGSLCSGGCNDWRRSARGAFCSTHFARRVGILQKLQPGPPTVAHGVSGPVKIIGEFMSGSGPPVPVLSAVQMCRLVGRDAQKICCISVSAVAHDDSRPEPADSDADPLPSDVHDAVNAELSQFSEVLVELASRAAS